MMAGESGARPPPPARRPPRARRSAPRGLGGHPRSILSALPGPYLVTLLSPRGGSRPKSEAARPSAWPPPRLPATPWPGVHGPPARSARANPGLHAALSVAGSGPAGRTPAVAARPGANACFIVMSSSFRPPGTPGWCPSSGWGPADRRHAGVRTGPRPSPQGPAGCHSPCTSGPAPLGHQLTSERRGDSAAAAHPAASFEQRSRSCSPWAGRFLVARWCPSQPYRWPFRQTTGPSSLGVPGGAPADAPPLPHPLNVREPRTPSPSSGATGAKPSRSPGFQPLNQTPISSPNFSKTTLAVQNET